MANHSDIHQPSDKLAYSPEEVATHLGLHINSVWAALRAGRIQGVRFGRKWVVPAKALERFLNDGFAEDSAVSGAKR